MADLNLQQISSRLNDVFKGDTRILVFWYDDKGDFVEDIDSLQLNNATVYKLDEHNQFQTKYFLERQDRTSNYLLYAPFPKPPVRQNHLEDMLLYSKRFYADRASLLCADLGIDPNFKPVLEDHIKFFASKERLKRFYDLQMKTYNEDTILVGIMSAICRTKVASFEAVLRQILCADLKDNVFLSEFAKYDVLDAFWQQCSRHLGYEDETPSLPELVATLFVTAAAMSISDDLPAQWQKEFLSPKGGSCVAFLDSMKDNVNYQSRYDELAQYTFTSLHADNVFPAMAPDALVTCDVFRAIDGYILAWITERLCVEDTGARLGDYAIPSICDLRRKMHFGKAVQGIYDLLYSAWYLIAAAHYESAKGLAKIIERYMKQDYRMDQEYRHFYEAYDTLENRPTGLETLRELVERIYTHEYLEKIVPAWNDGLQETKILDDVPLQRHFYDHFIRPNKERTVVIISDGLRYEVAQELYQAMQNDPNSKSSLTYMVSTVPSYTRLGMAALLPHRTLNLNDNGDVLADGILCNSLDKRQQVLQQAMPNSRCVPFDSLKKMKRDELRNVFTGQQVIYIYHDQIDVHGENEEDAVFKASSEAVQEIVELIRKIYLNANTYRFLVTADHGFIYKRDKVTESGKIDGVKGIITKRRYVIADDPITEMGIDSLPLAYVLGNQDTRTVSFPHSAHVFKTQGGGQNYVHGGSSPQEMLVPVLAVKMDRGHVDTHNVPITMVSLVKKITNLFTSLDFIQSEPVSDVAKACTYQLYFADDDGKPVSQELTYVADSRAAESKERIFTLNFHFKNQKYDNTKPYYLIVKEKGGMEAQRYEMMIDLAFADDYGFDL